MKKTKKIRVICILILCFLLIQWSFIGYRFNYGPLKALGDIRMARFPGNSEKYSMKTLSVLQDNPWRGSSERNDIGG